eukprot:gb/GEZN01000132.1/.p1 GENE.gb/GEZN01000132.1/~~gb/GEZN01000132.1/.p1  ORF type:complete len:2209 (+),score=301.38 gb/GEZN01000132.1/:280-6627(+)
MTPSDATVMYVEHGQVIVEDYFLANRRELCPGICKDIDYTPAGEDNTYNISGHEKDGFTEIHWTRPISAHDDYDTAIPLDREIFLIYAWNTDDSDALMYHKRGRRVVPVFFGQGLNSLVASSASSGVFLHTLQNLNHDFPLRTHVMLTHIAWLVLLPFALFLRNYGATGPRVGFGFTRGALLISAVLLVCLVGLNLADVAMHMDSASSLTFHAVIGLVADVFSLMTALEAILECFSTALSLPEKLSLWNWLRSTVQSMSVMFGLLSLLSGLALSEAVASQTWPTLLSFLVSGFAFLCLGAADLATQGKAEALEANKARKKALITLRLRADFCSVVWLTLAFVLALVAVSRTPVTLLPPIPAEGILAPVLNPDRLDHLITYYLQGEDTEWDYIPSGTNLKDPENPAPIVGPAATFVHASSTTLGSKVRKMRFFQYTDSSFTEKVVQPKYLGLLNIIMKCEVGDTILIIARNRGNHSMSLHPHGVFYDKAAEGANYNDRSSVSKAGRAIAPGDEFTYVWPCMVRSGPVEGEPVDATPWMFHGHRIGEDTNLGQVGAIVVYRAGTTSLQPLPGYPTLVYPALKPTPEGQPRKDFFLLFNTFDESVSPYFFENWQRNTGDNVTPDIEALLAKRVDAGQGFWFGVRYNAINGYMFDNMPRPQIDQGDLVYWYVGIFGDSYDASKADFGEYPVATIVNGALVPHHDLYMLAGTTFTLVMNATKSGNFSIGNGNRLLQFMGSECSFTVNPKAGYFIPDPSFGRLREYFIRAEQMYWNHCPDGPIDGRTGQPLNADPPGFPTLLLCVPTQTFFGPLAIKIVYRSYTDATFSTRAPEHPEDEHLALLGPIIRGVVGDTIKIHFYNNVSGMDLNMWVDGPVGSASPAPVASGQTVVYIWKLPKAVGPSDQDVLSSTMWPYSSSLPDQLQAASMGLLGALLVTRRGKGDAISGRPLDVDHEYIVLLQTTYDAVPFNPLYQALLKYHNDTIVSMNNGTKQAGGSPTYNNFTDLDWLVFNIDSQINGISFGQLKGLNMNIGERVRFHTFTVGDRNEFHSLTFHGNSILTKGLRRDGVSLLANSVVSVDMTPEHIGNFSLSCHITDHLTFGMFAMYEVSAATDQQQILRTPVPPAQQLTGRVRKFYLTAEEELWDYAPQNRNELMNRSFNAYEQTWTQPGPMNMGKHLLKARYHEYTDASFSVKKARPAKWAHAGILGPILECCVGDVLEVTFKNNATVPFSIIAHGGLTQNEIEVMQGVPPGGQTKYTWEVRESAGPAEGDTSSVLWPYHSWVQALGGMDFLSGLLGAVVVRERDSCDGQSDLSESTPRGVDREFVVWMGNIEETKSVYVMTNLAKTSAGEAAVAAAGVGLLDAPFMINYNTMHSINGYLYANHAPDVTENTAYTMKQGEVVRWYAIGFGNRADRHTEHWHAQTFISQIKTRIDIFSIGAGTVYITDMLADDPGIWLFHCHMGDHFDNGMSSLFEVVGKDEASPKALPLPVEVAPVFHPSLALGALSFSYSLVAEGSALVGSLRGPPNAEWLGIGFGESMQNADILWFERKADGWSLADSYAVFEEKPRPDPDVSQANLLSYEETPAYVEVVFRRPLAAAGLYDKAISLQVLTPLIFAYSLTPTAYHGRKQRFQSAVAFGMDGTEIEAAASKYTQSKIFLYHGIGMSLLWLVFAPLSFFIVRYQKYKPYWLKVHKTSMMIVAGLTMMLVGLVATQTSFQMSGGTHSWIGVSIFSIILFQMIVGMAVQHFRSTLESSNATLTAFQGTVSWLIPPLLWKNGLSLFHKYTGRALVLAGPINCYLGMHLLPYPPAASIYLIYIFSVAMLFVVVEVDRSMGDLQAMRKQYENIQSRKSDEGPAEVSTWIAHDPMMSAGNELSMDLHTFNEKVKNSFMLVIYRDHIYDVEAFAPMHPGGEYLIRMAVGRDITEAFEGGMVSVTGESNMHSTRARAVLENCVLAKLTHKEGKGPAVLTPAAMAKTFAHRAEGSPSVGATRENSKSESSGPNTEISGSNLNNEWQDKGQSSMFKAGDAYKTDMTDFDQYAPASMGISRINGTTGPNDIEGRLTSTSSVDGGNDTPYEGVMELSPSHSVAALSPITPMPGLKQSTTSEPADMDADHS